MIKVNFLLFLLNSVYPTVTFSILGGSGIDIVRIFCRGNIAHEVERLRKKEEKKIESVIHSLLIHLVEVSNFVYIALEVRVCETFLLLPLFQNETVVSVSVRD